MIDPIVEKIVESIELITKASMNADHRIMDLVQILTDRIVLLEHQVSFLYTQLANEEKKRDYNEIN